MEEKKEYTDESTGVQLIVEKDNPDYPGYPKLTIICPKQVSSIDVINDETCLGQTIVNLG